MIGRMVRAVLLALLLATGAGAWAAGEIAARLPDGRTLQFRCFGGGRQTILFDAGWGADSRAWGALMPPLAKTARVCAYDRASYGGSDPGPLPRDGTAIARDLDDGLRAARIRGPFVLVGHSAGALYVRHLLLRRRQEVIGMVLVDPTVEHQQRRFEAVFGPGAGTLAPLIERASGCIAAAQAGTAQGRCLLPPPTAARWENRRSELETLFDKTSSRLDGNAGDFGAIPVIVLTASRTYPPPFAAVWRTLHRELAFRSTKGEERLVESGHLMMNDNREAIVTAIRDVLARR